MQTTTTIPIGRLTFDLDKLEAYSQTAKPTDSSYYVCYIPTGKVAFDKPIISGSLLSFASEEARWRIHRAGENGYKWASKHYPLPQDNTEPVAQKEWQAVLA